MANMLERSKNVKTPKKTRAEHAEDALYREVWEEVNNEKTLRFVKKYYRYILAMALIIMIAVVGIQIGMQYHNSKKVAVAQMYESAIENVDVNALAALSGETGGAMADLALFQAYAIDGDVKKIEQLAKKGNTRDFRDLAKLHMVGLRGDDMSAKDVESYLSDMDSKASPFYYDACLVIAQKYLAEGNRELSNKWLDKIIKDKDAPATVSGAASALR